MITALLSRPQNINVSDIKQHYSKPKLKNKTQLILLYLKYISKNIDYQTFCSFYKIPYNTYKEIIKTLLQKNIIKRVNKNNSIFYSYKLIKNNIKIFSYSSKSDEQLILKYLHSKQHLTDHEIDYIHIILNPHALQILKHIKKKYNSKSFKKSSIVANSKTKARAFKFLIDHKALKKTRPHTYVLTQFHDHAIEQIQLKKNPPIIYKVDPNSIIKEAKWQKFNNVHNLSIEAQFEGLYYDLFSLSKYQHQFNNGEIGEGIIFLKETIQKTQVTVIIYREQTIITIKCSEKPIYSNKLLQLNKILVEVIYRINKEPHVSRQHEYNYHNFIVKKFDLALDSKIPYRIKKGSCAFPSTEKDDQGFHYKNSDNQRIYMYVKKNYKSSHSSWVRCEIRANNQQQYTIHEFRQLIIDSPKLNIIPK